MLRQSASRNQRKRGFRLTRVLQGCLLVVVGIWLLYQLKHSYDKKQAIEAKAFDRVAESQPDLLKLGRKDLPQTEERRDKEDGGEEAEEEEEQETKQETDERGDGDDEIDEAIDHNQERVEKEVDSGEESTEEADGDNQVEGMDAIDEEEHEEGLREAREEHYKRDDASSAVHHDTRSTESEFGNGDATDPDQKLVEDTANDDAEREIGAGEKVEDSKRSNDAIVVAVDGSSGNASSIVHSENETLPINHLPTNVEKHEAEGDISKSEPQSFSNSNSLPEGTQNKLNESTRSDNKTELQTDTKVTASNNRIEAKNNSTELDAMNNSSKPLQNDQNTTAFEKEPHMEDKPNLADAAVQQSEKSNTIGNGNVVVAQREQEDNASKNKDTHQSESDGKVIESGGAAQAVADNSLNNAVTAEKRDAGTDLLALSDLESKAKNEGNEAVE